jgi:hypothetical protein
VNNQRKIGLIGGIIVVMVLIVWLFSGGDDPQQGKAQRQPYVSSDWNTRFQPFDKTPLGLYFFNTLANSHLDNKHDVYVVQDWIELDSIIASSKYDKTYMFVGNIFGLESSEIDSIMADVARGSRIFLSYNQLTENLYPRFFKEYKENFDYTESINVYANKKKHNMINLHQNDTIATEWYGFGEIEPLGDYKPLSSFMEMENFIKMEYGDGFVYLHTTPAQYYNYQIKRTDGYRYAAFTLNQLPKNQDILLLELGRQPDDIGNYDVDQNDGSEGKEDNSYLRVIFENPPLLIAMLLSILGLILFVIFRSKRTRPVVPYIDKKKNMTLAFAETITSIYFAKRNPYGLLNVHKKNFYATIQKHFFIDLSRRDGDREIDMLSEKSDKSKEEIKSLIAALETKNASNVDDQFVTEIAKKKRKFYVDTGIVSEKILGRVENDTMVFRRVLWLPGVLVLTGIFLIFFGTYYLMQSIGVGIVLWPIGIITLVLGILRSAKPFMEINKEKIIYYTPFAQKRVYDRVDLIRTEMLEKGAVLHFTNDRKLIINNWDLSLFDRKQFERFIQNLHKYEL